MDSRKNQLWYTTKKAPKKSDYKLFLEAIPRVILALLVTLALVIPATLKWIEVIKDLL